MAFKMKGSPMKRNFGIGASPVKDRKEAWAGKMADGTPEWDHEAHAHNQKHEKGEWDNNHKSTEKSALKHIGKGNVNARGNFSWKSIVGGKAYSDPIFHAHPHGTEGHIKRGAKAIGKAGKAVGKGVSKAAKAVGRTVSDTAEGIKDYWGKGSRSYRKHYRKQRGGRRRLGRNKM